MNDGENSRRICAELLSCSVDDTANFLIIVMNPYHNEKRSIMKRFFPLMLTSLGLGFWTSEALAQQPWGIRPNIEDLQLSPTEYDQLRTALYRKLPAMYIL